MNNYSQCKKLLITPGCISCGVCFASSPYFSENSDGSASVTGAGYVPENDFATVEEVMANCPAKVICLQAMQSKTKTEVLQIALERLENYKLPVPPKSEFAFNKNTIYVPIPYSSGEYKYIYSSYERAKRAGLDEFNRLMFSQRKMIIQNIFIGYKTDRLLPYYRYEQASNNFYYKIEIEIQKLLEEIATEAKLAKPDLKLPSDFTNFSLSFDPKKADIAEFFKTGYEQLCANRVLSYLNADCYSLSSYDVYYDIDDSEEYVGTGMFGRDKYVTKYCFHNLSEAFTSLANDIIGGCQSELSDAVDEAYSYLQFLWKESEKHIRKQLGEKAKELKTALN